MELTVNIYCKDCDDELMANDDGDGNVTVEPCATCIKDAQESAKETGKEEGHDEGYDEGHEAGHDEGYTEGYEAGTEEEK